MNRLSSNDKNYGPLTIASWHKSIGCYLDSGDSEHPETHLLLTLFRKAIRLKLPFKIKPFGKYGEHPRRYGFSLADVDIGQGYNFLQVFYGQKLWSKILTWKQWKHIRLSLYAPEGQHFFTEGKHGWEEFIQMMARCPTSSFSFEDYDGEMIVATCLVEEREWSCGEGWFSWLRFFHQNKVVRSLTIRFSHEVGPEKGSHKGGTVGHGIDMLPHETPRQAFERYCAQEHTSRGKAYRLRFIGPAKDSTCKFPT